MINVQIKQGGSQGRDSLAAATSLYSQGRHNWTCKIKDINT